MHFCQNPDTISNIASLSQHKLGVLIANVDQLAGVLASGQPPAATAQDKEPNVLPLSTAKNETAGYFSLLPVMSVPSNAQQATSGQPAKAPPGTEVGRLLDVGHLRSEIEQAPIFYCVFLHN